MKYTHKTTRLQYEQTPQQKFIFFWGHQPSKDGSIIKSCFSQWWEASFEIAGISYPTAEHYMMVEKARLFKNLDLIEPMLKAKHPHAVKKLGRSVKNFDSVVWNQHRFDIVKTANLEKFAQNKALKTYLLNTGDRIIVEASPVDAIWGIGLAENDPKALNPNHWEGENLLGYALMEVRDLLKKS